MSGATEAAADQGLAEKISLLDGAVTEAAKGAITNARKMEALSSLEDTIPSLQRTDIIRQQSRVEDLVERLLAQNATEPLRRLATVVLNKLYQHGDFTALPTFVGRLLKLTGEQNKKVSTDTRVAALDVIGELMVHHGQHLEEFSTDVFVVIAKHMKFPEASARCSAFHCLCKTIRAAGVKSASISANIWKMLQKMLLDKTVTVRAAAAHSLSALVAAAPACAGANGDAMAVSCLKALSTDDPPNQISSALSSECRVAFADALAQVLAGMANPAALTATDRPKKKPAVTDFGSAVDFLEQATVKGPTSGAALLGFRAAICVAASRLVKAMGIGDSASMALVMRMLLCVVDLPSQGKLRGGSAAEDEILQQVARYLAATLSQLLAWAEAEGCLLETIDQGLIPLVSAQFNEASRGTDLRMQVVLEALSCACIAAGESFRTVETKVSKPLLHLVGNHPNPLVQLHAAYCLRVVAHSSPAQLFQLMSVLLNLATVQNAELLGAPVPKAGEKPAAATAKAPGHVNMDMQATLRGLFGHCAALASLSTELYHSDLGVPHDVTSAVLGTSRALLQPHSDAVVSAQRRSCAFILLEGLMGLGTDWVGTRLTTLFALWKTALGKKPVDRAKVLYQQHAAASSTDGGANSAESTGNACRHELVSLLCALRSLHAFTLHSHETLLTSLPHLHKILVVFMTNISQLVTTLPHPTSASLRAKYRTDAPGQCRNSVITLSTHCSIPDILLMIRATMYRTFAVTQYSQRYVQLLNMLADDATRPVTPEFPVADLMAHFLPPDDIVLDLVDPYTETSKDSVTTIRLAVARLLGPAAPAAAAGGPREGPLPAPPSAAPSAAATWPAAALRPGAAASPAGPAESPAEIFSDAAASSFFSGAPREGPGSIEGMLTPWDAWFTATRPLAAQCISAEWDWRCSAISLLAIIMNSPDVAENPRGLVLQHLLKQRKESGEDHFSKKGSNQADLLAVPTLAVLAYLREHVKMRGIKCSPPQAPTEQILQASIEGLKDPNPIVRCLHVEVLALLFYIHHQQPDSPVVPTILQQIATETAAESPAVRSAVALLCGAIMRAFDWGSQQLVPGAGKSQRRFNCPYLINIVPALLKLAKETAQPVRLWMLHAIRLSVQAAGPAFSPYLKDASRLATAHLLADFFETPLVLWVIAEFVHSAASTIGSQSADAGQQEENAQRILGIWSELKHVQYLGPGAGAAFATVRTEVMCIRTAHSVVRLAPKALSQLKDVFELVSAKLSPRKRGGSMSCAVRTAAAHCMTELIRLGCGMGNDGIVTQEPSQLFALLEDARGMETEALQELIRALIRQRGLAQLPQWLQAFKVIILAIPPRGAGAAGAPEKETAQAEEGGRPSDEHDDGASMAGPRPTEASVSKRHRAPRSATKIFAAACTQLLVEQVDPESTWHFQTDLPTTPSRGVPTPDIAKEQHRLVHHLETLIALAAHASSSDEPSLATVGLRLALLLVDRFRRTRDVMGGTEDSDVCPLLLVQYEAQVSTCIRHNLHPQANPRLVSLALELLRDVIAAGACNSIQRLITLLVQPLSNAAFEPDPLFCECASTKTFLLRLRLVCEILDSGREDQPLSTHTKDLARWLECAFRDAAVLLAGMPPPSIKTYQPVCFSLADYKAVQPLFREALPILLRGVCALCSQHHRSWQSPATVPDLFTLALGIIGMLLNDPQACLIEVELRIHIRCIRQVLQFSIAVGGKDTGIGGFLGVTYFLDLLGCLWRNVFKMPNRGAVLLPDLVELLHSVTGAVLRQRKKSGASPVASGDSELWLDTLCQDTEEGRCGRGTVAAYAFHVVAAGLRSSAVAGDAARLAQVLEVFLLWLGECLQESLDPSQGELSDPPDAAELVAAELDADTSAVLNCSSSDNLRTGCFWLWLLFMSPFPLDLVQTQTATTLKYWKLVCSILSQAPQSQSGNVDPQLLYLALIANKLCSSLLASMESSGAALSESQEREVVYLFALLVPAVTSFCGVIQNAAGGNPASTECLCSASIGSGGVKAAANALLEMIRQVFTAGTRHQDAKVAHATVSSMQSLVQNKGCAVLLPTILPSLVVVLVGGPQGAAGLAPPVVQAAWGIIPVLLVGQQEAGESKLVGETTRLVLRLVLSIADFDRQRPGSFSAGHLSAMAQCLVQVARIDQQGLKQEVATMSGDSQQTIQLLLREHMSQGQSQGSMAADANAAAAAAPKIELKMKF